MYSQQMSDLCVEVDQHISDLWCRGLISGVEVDQNIPDLWCRGRSAEP